MYNLKRGGGPYPAALIDFVVPKDSEAIEAGMVCAKDSNGELIKFIYSAGGGLTPANGDEHIPTFIAERNQSDSDVDTSGKMTVLIGNGVCQVDTLDADTYAYGDTIVPSTATSGNLMKGTGTFAAPGNQPCVGFYDGADTFDLKGVSTDCHNIIKVLPCGEVYIG